MLRRWDPVHEMRQMEDTMNRLWRGFMPDDGDPTMESWGVPLDVVQQGDNIVVQASLPGVDPEAIDVSIENDVLTIKAETKQEQEHTEGRYLMRERRIGSFHRALRLPDTVDIERVEPKYENGVLTISFPKQESKKAKHLKVSGSQALEGEKK